MAVELAATEYGDGTPVAILHGLFGSGRNWASIAQRLAAHHRVIAFDLRNHGASRWHDTMDYVAMAEDVRAAMRARGYRRYALIGHSMGGKAAMVLALSNPETVARLIVVDIAPITAPAVFMPAIVALIRAMRGLDLDAVTRRREADDALASTISDPGTRAFVLQSLVFDEGRPRWRLNLTVLEAAMPALAGFPAFPPGTQYEGPALFIAGGKSPLVTASAEPAIHALFPRAMIERIAEAGHWVHTEQPAAFLTLAESFLAADAD
ncbi:MAG TPA: alpha/beta fold hydrolase [Stellaceae bacterium]|jgi:esterase|nr:alpha/beta fold hydrolase [Stellaceae bacterium]